MLGDLSEVSLADILQMFERAAKTGQLSIWSQNGIYRIWFFQGRIVATLSPEKQHLLKQLLMDCQDIDQEVIAQINTLFSLNEPIGIFLKKRAYISASQLATVFRKQLQVGLYDLFALQSGQFRFAPNVSPPFDEMTGMSKGGMDAAIEGLRRVELQTQNHKNLPLPDSIFTKIVTEPPILKLSDLEWNAWMQIAPQNSVRVIAQRLNSDLLETRKACYRLMQVGLIEEIPASLTQPTDQALTSSPEKPTTLQKELKTSKSESSTLNLTLLKRLTSVLKSIR